MTALNLSVFVCVCVRARVGKCPLWCPVIAVELEEAKRGFWLEDSLCATSAKSLQSPIASSRSFNDATS